MFHKYLKDEIEMLKKTVQALEKTNSDLNKEIANVREELDLWHSYGLLPSADEMVYLRERYRQYKSEERQKQADEEKEQLDAITTRILRYHRKGGDENV